MSIRFWVAKGWSKWIFVLIALLAVDMLVRTGSRTAFLAIAFSVIFTLLFFSKSRTKWIDLLLVFIFCITLFLTNYGGVVDRVKDLLVNLTSEERIYFWKSASEMLKKNNLINWIFGNGIGGYRAVYPEYAIPKFRHFWFAHLHAIEILYENGITGVLLVYGGLLALFGLTIKTLRDTVSENISLLTKCTIVIFLCWMIHSNLTFPFYSKYAQYPFGFILGMMLVLINCSRPVSKN